SSRIRCSASRGLMSRSACPFVTKATAAATAPSRDGTAPSLLATYGRAGPGPTGAGAGTGGGAGWRMGPSPCPPPLLLRLHRPRPARATSAAIPTAMRARRREREGEGAISASRRPEQHVDGSGGQPSQAGPHHPGYGQLLAPVTTDVVAGVLGQAVDGGPDQDAGQGPPEGDLVQPPEKLLDECRARHAGRGGTDAHLGEQSTRELDRCHCASFRSWEERFTPSQTHLCARRPPVCDRALQNLLAVPRSRVSEAVAASGGTDRFGARRRSPFRTRPEPACRRSAPV